METDAREAIRQYLDNVSRHLSPMPDARRAELLRDITSHVYDAIEDRTKGREATLEDVRIVLAEMDLPESYAQASQNAVPYTADLACRITRGGRVPRPLMFGLSVLGVIVVVQLVIALLTGNIRLLIGAILSGLLLAGLGVGNKAAYLITILAVAGGAIRGAVTKGLGFGIMVFLVDCLVLIPVLLCTSYFFPKRNADSKHVYP